MTKVTYLGGDTSQFGYDFKDGKSVDVTDPDHLAKFSSNQFFTVDGAQAPDQGGDGEQIAEDHKRDEKGDTKEMAAMRGQFDEAYAAQGAALKAAVADVERLKAELDAAKEELKALKKTPPAAATVLKAEHHGGPHFNITQGETVVLKGLSKADAEAFNALTDAEKAEFVKGEIAKK